MNTTIYLALAAFLIIFLSLRVIRLRRSNKVAYGDGGNDELKVAIRTHANAIEYLPISLLLLMAFEINMGTIWVIHVLGIVLIVGRLVHAWGMSAQHRKGRVLGMQLTFLMMTATAILAILSMFDIHVPY